MMIAGCDWQFGVTRLPARRPAVAAGFLFVLLSTTLVRGQPVLEVSGEDISSVLTARLSAQVAAWNDGDIERFMQYYWKSERLSFSSGGRTVWGWQATRDGYYRRYPDRNAMGRLAFERLDITPLGATAALVLGHWQLDRTAGPLRGNFTLVFQQIEGQWLIIHDHTSLLPLEPDAGDG